ncbi:phosphate transport system regulatory protein PhoU [Halobacteriales archaeon QS_1_68_17]|nr:MAG: phosphate transport system regulatory protein PhoU [Halobacteriales archaeon QS_1_68_17]
MARDQHRLDALADGVCRMGDVVVTRLRKAITALERDDPALAARAVDRDGEVNALYADLEADCIELFALDQPVAGDLRFIAASFKIITDLERVADLTTNLGGYWRGATDDLLPRSDLAAVGRVGAGMVEDAMAAFAARDATACTAVAERDDDLDVMCEQAGRRVIRDLAGRAPGETIDQLLAAVDRTLLAIRDLERIGDHAVNIAARTRYMIDGDASLIY